MKLIIGLGNPGKQYENTRHNVGFMVLDRLKYIAQNIISFSDFKMNEKFKSLISEGTDSSGEKVLLIKPQTFMNRSGDAVRELMNFYKVPFENISVIHDDKDIALGSYRIANNSSSAGHNGVQDIIDKLGTQEFKRIRIGIGAESDLPTDAFVLQKFTDEEIEMLPLTKEKVAELGIAGGIAF